MQQGYLLVAWEMGLMFKKEALKQVMREKMKLYHPKLAVGLCMMLVPVVLRQATRSWSKVKQLLATLTKKVNKETDELIASVAEEKKQRKEEEAAAAFAELMLEEKRHGHKGKNRKGGRKRRKKCARRRKGKKSAKRRQKRSFFARQKALPQPDASHLIAKKSALKKTPKIVAPAGKSCADCLLEECGSTPKSCGKTQAKRRKKTPPKCVSPPAAAESRPEAVATLTSAKLSKLKSSGKTQTTEKSSCAAAMTTQDPESPARTHPPTAHSDKILTALKPSVFGAQVPLLPDRLNLTFDDTKKGTKKIEQCDREVAIRQIEMGKHHSRVSTLLVEIKRLENAKKTMELRVTKADDEVQQTETCVVCLEEPKTILLMPCRHLCLCDLCAKVLVSCPLCRAKIQKRISVFV